MSGSAESHAEMTATHFRFFGGFRLIVGYKDKISSAYDTNCSASATRRRYASLAQSPSSL